MSLTKLQLEQELRKLDVLMQERELQYSFLLQKVHPSQHDSAINLLHYLSLRSVDIRNLQYALHDEGFSTLAYAEAYIRSQLLAILQHFNFNGIGPSWNFLSSQAIVRERAANIFGTGTDNTIPAIMVTFQTSYAHDFITVKKLLKAGMNIARINCAHDDEKTWLQMVKRVRETSKFSGFPCKIYMDLAGPKIRTSIKGKKERIELEEEDIFLLTDDEDLKTKLPVVGCTMPGIVAQLKVGERVFFDDGLIETKVVGKRTGAAELEVIHVYSKKPYLKTEKGINFPDSQLSLSALTDFDRKHIPFVLEHADMVGYSFIHNTPDLVELQNEMRQRKMPVILKIETPEAVKNLPDLLFTAMREEYFGVMIARGDLAVEIGFEQMGEVQDEILSLCRAGHIPVVFATQVLENMNKKGIPTRAEVTDASYGIMADCVMLNKGPYTAQTIKILKDILRKKADHLFRNRLVYSTLPVAADFFKNHSGQNP